MKLIRLTGVCLAVLLSSACDKEPPTPPKAPVPAPPAVAAPAQPATQPAKAEPAPAEPVKSEPAKPEQAVQAKPASKPAPAPKVVTEPVEPKVQTPKPANTAKASSKASASESAPVVVRKPQPPEKIQRLQVNKPQTAAQRQASEAVKKQKLEKPKLDLHLPKEMVNKLEPQVSGTPGTRSAPNAAAAPALLPQMFADKPEQQSSFEMGGRIITNDRSRDQDKDSSYWDTVDGAELQFKFRH